MNKVIFSLAGWTLPRVSVVRRIIALGMAMSFLLPTVSWAFQVQAYEAAEGATGIIPVDLGRVVESSRGTNGNTLYIVQDLHCNYEVQTNIRRILNDLKKKNPNLKLIAVEGATGIVPTRTLAAIPNSPAKRAVLAYFMREGKLTGADCVTVCDQAEMELFGAENPDIYAKSLALIQDFATEANRGLVFELLDRIKFLETRQGNPALVAFEKRRESVIMGRISVQEYHRTLIREAGRMGISISRIASKFSNQSWDMYERTMLDRILEEKIREKLFKSDAERQLSAYHQYVEMAEHILTVSASQAEINVFKQRSETLSLGMIQKNIQTIFAKMDYYAGMDSTFGEEVAALEKMVKKGLQFYQLAEQRNRVLFDQTVTRLRSRGEQSAVLVSGGFHTPAIAELARSQGYSVVTLRPRQERPEVSNNYFLRLRFPDQPTELEQMLSQRQVKGNAIAVPNALVNETFQANVGVAVDESQRALDALQGKTVVTAENEKIEKRQDGIVRLSLPRGAEFFLTFVKGELFVDRNIEKVREFRQNAGLNTLPAGNAIQGTLRLPVVRIAGLAILGVGLAFLTAQIVAGLAVTPMLVIGVVGLVLMSAWAISNVSEFSLARLATPRNAIMSSLIAGTMAFSAFLGSLMSSAFIKLSGVAADPTNLAARAVAIVAKGMSIVGLAPHAQDPMVAGTMAINTLNMAANVLVGSLFSGPIRLAVGVTKILMFKNSSRVLGRPFSKAAADAIAQVIEKREQEEKGILYNENEARPAKGSFALLSEEAVDQMLGVLKDLGLVKFEDSTPVDIFIKPTVNINQDHISPTPIESELVFQMPKSVEGKIQLLFRVIVMDPMFIDEKGKNLNLTQVPDKYVAGVLNCLNPLSFFKAIGPQQLNPLFARAGKFEATFKANFAAAVKKWQGRTGPQDLPTLQKFLQQGLLHEFTHALALNMPDNVPTDLPKAEQDRLNQFSVTAYINLLNTATELHTSVVYTKNLVKALQAVEGQEPSATTQNQVVRVLSLEMFCDRFSMYMYEMFMKLQAYHEVIADLGDLSVDSLRKMEKQRKNNPDAFKTVNELNDEEMRALAQKLDAAEKAHVYIEKFGDPVISEAERGIFEPFLDLLRHFDKEKSIDLFTEEHTKGEFFKASHNGTFISDNKMGVEEIVKQTEDLSAVEGPGGISVAVGNAVQAAVGIEQPIVTGLVDQDPTLVPVQETTETASLDDWLNSAATAAPVSMALDKTAEVAVPVLDLVETAATSSQRMGIEKPVVANLDADLDDWLNDAVATPSTAVMDLETEETAQKDLSPEERARQELLTANNQVQTVSIQQVQMDTAVTNAVHSQNIGTTANLLERTTEEARRGKFNTSALMGTTGAMIIQNQHTAAPVAQQATTPQLTAASEALSAARGSSLVPALFDDFRATPAPPPAPHPPVYFYTNDVHLAYAVLESLMVQQRPVNVTADEWTLFTQNVQVVMVDVNKGIQSPGADMKGIALNSGKMQGQDPDAIMQQLSQLQKVGMPSSGSVNGMIALTPQEGTPTLTGIVYPNGRVGVPTEVMGVSLNQVPAESIPQSIRDQSDALKRSLMNGNEFNDMLLLSAAQSRDAAIRDLLGNSFKPVQVVVDTTALDLLQTLLGAMQFAQLQNLLNMIRAQDAQIKSAFKDGAKVVPVATENISRETVEAAAKAVAHGNVVVFGSSASSVETTLFGLNGLSEAAKAQGMIADHLGALDLLAENTAGRDGENVLDALDAMELRGSTRLNTALGDRSAVSSLAGRALSQAQKDLFAEELKSTDQVVFMSKDRYHGTAWGQQDRLGRETPAALLVIAYNKGKGVPGQKMAAAGKMIPEFKKTPFLGSKGWVKTFSMLALGVASLTLVGRSLRQVNLPLTKGFKAQRLPLLPIMTHPSFLKALRLMARIIVGNYGDREVVDPVLRQQLADLRQLDLSKIDLNTLKQSETPESLRYVLGHLVWVRNFLTNLPFFQAVMKLRGIQIETLNPELLMLVNEFTQMQSVTWYFAKRTYLLKQIEARKSVMDETLWNFLMSTPAELVTASKDRAEEVKNLVQKAQLSESEVARVKVLRMELKHLRFAKRFHEVLNQIDADTTQTPRLVKSLISKLVIQLSREDATEKYRDSVLQVLSLIDPDNQITVMMTTVRDGQIKNVYLNIPEILRNSPVYLEMFLRNYPLYDSKGRPIVAPERNRIVSALQAA